MSVITRIAPSPTGMLHIGTARTALFNYLYAKHHGGQFFLRIEDTDRERSTQESVDAIINSLRWLGLHWEGDAVYQYARSARHAEVAHALIAHGHAFKCYTTQAELEEFRKANPNAKFRSPWRDKHEHPNLPYVVRLKAPEGGAITVQDLVQGDVTVDAKELDDMVLLRSDGNPTYMLAVVVDDHDMGVTHVIRGTDHLTNTFRQLMIYRAMGWGEPQFGHIPLIHGADGAKLSKRHGALGVQEYEKMGFLPEALRNYLLRLGWSHGDEEIISDAQAVQWFDLDAVGKSPARFDFAKLENLNAHYIREAEDERLVELIYNLQFTIYNDGLLKDRLLKAMPGLKARAKTLVELAENAAFYIERPPLDDKAKSLLEGNGYAIVKALIPQMESLAGAGWNQAALEALARSHAEATGQKLGAVAQPLRALLTGRATSPPVFEVMEVLGREESLKRLRG